MFQASVCDLGAEANVKLLQAREVPRDGLEGEVGDIGALERERGGPPQAADAVVHRGSVIDGRVDQLLEPRVLEPLDPLQVQREQARAVGRTETGDSAPGAASKVEVLEKRKTRDQPQQLLLADVGPADVQVRGLAAHDAHQVGLPDVRAPQVQ